MRVLICIDVEGVSGISNHTMLDNSVFEETKILVTDDALAAIRGVRKARPDAAIDIFDAHGMGGNLLADELDAECHLLGGGWMTTLRGMVGDGSLAKYDVALLLGQHAAAGTTNGFMSHTNTLFTASKWNGMPAGEAPQLAWLFGEFGLPVGLVVGDAAVGREVGNLLEDVDTVVVKEVGANRGLADCIPTDQAHDAIEQACCRAVESHASLRPQKLSVPVDLQILYSTTRMADMASEFPRFERADDQSVRYQAETFQEGWEAYNTSRTISEAGAKADLLADLAKLEVVVTQYKEAVAELVRVWLEAEPPFPPVLY